ncbi:MAG: hypothetical protein ACI9CF_000131 [Candidatus Omnitrophota bacterium]|jgi:hypothetical protein
MTSFHKKVAPAALIQRDFENLNEYKQLYCSNPVREALYIQSIEGRSHTGSGVFKKRAFVNTTIDDVVKALNRNPDETKAFRQKNIDEILDFVDATINGQERNRLVNLDGEPFLGIPLFKDKQVNARDVLRGLYLGGLRDNPDIRKETESRYQIRIGCGECYHVDIRQLEIQGFNGDSISHGEHEDQIEAFKESGLIINHPEDDENTVPEEFRRYFYIRHREGPGQSDDAAIIIAGILYNADVALGVFLSDAIDTLEKYTLINKDQDQELSYYIGRAFKDLNLSMDDVYELAYLCAIPEREEEFIPDSSLRYLLSVDEKSGVSALQAHLLFMEDKKFPKMYVSFKRASNVLFYKFIRRQLTNVHRINTPTPQDTPNLTTKSP